jgi:hypothetical protein
MEKSNLNLLLLVLLALAPAQALAQSTNPKAPDLPAVVISAKAIEDALAPVGWRRYQFGDRPAFSVFLPTEPEVSASATSDTTTNLYTTANSNGVYIAARIDFVQANLEKAAEASREKYFQEFFAGFAKGFQEGVGKTNPTYELQLLNPKKVMTASGREGYQQDMTVGSFKGQAQLIFVNRSAFCVISIWSQKTPAAETEAFFKSFKLTASPD